MINLQNKFLNHIPLVLSAVICFLFGLACLSLVQAAGDGVWYFYANGFLQGKKIYSDLNLIQQPVFILINALGIAIFGKTYLGQKLIFAFVLAAYTYLSYLITTCIKNASPIYKSVVLLAFFFSGIHFVAYRFDDYHAFENLIIMMIFYLTARLIQAQKIDLVFFLGACTGIAILTRVNDGLMVFLTLLFIIFITQFHEKVIQKLLIFIFSTLSAMGIVFCILRETPFAWSKATILNAASAKGGDGGIILAPFKLIIDCLNYLHHDGFHQELLLMGCIIILSFITYYFLKSNSKILKCLAIIFTIIALKKIFLKFRFVDMIDYFTAIAYLTAIIYALKNLPGWFRNCMTREKLAHVNSLNSILILIPLSLYVSGSMSSGGVHFSLYFPFALSFITFLILPDDYRTNSQFNLIVFLFACFIALQGFYFRSYNPYSWHSYYSPPLTEKRLLIKNSNMGSFLINRKLYEFITPVCQHIQPGTTLLSLPFPYANYYCGIAPWHGYVQTFFDTSTKIEIDQLINELKNEPPDYIFYQRQLDNLALHEKIFNNGKPLPQRELDTIIMKKVNLHTWKVIYKVNFGEGSDWFLIQTKTHHKKLRPSIRSKE